MRGAACVSDSKTVFLTRVDLSGESESKGELEFGLENGNLLGFNSKLKSRRLIFVPSIT